MAWDWKLIVWLSTDEFCKLKWKLPVFSYRYRKQLLEELRCVDEVIPEERWEQKTEDIKKYLIDIFIMGDDWKWKFDSLDCEVIYVPRTEDVCTTKLKEIVFKDKFK